MPDRGSSRKKRRRAPGSAAQRQRVAPVPASRPAINPDQERIERAKSAVIARFADVTVLAGRIVRRYSPLERDQALLEVQTEQGFFEVILGRDGSMTVFHPDERPGGPK